MINFLNEYIIFIDFGVSDFMSYKQMADSYLAFAGSLNIKMMSVYFRMILNRVVERGSYIYVF